MSRCSGCRLIYQRERLRREHLAGFYGVQDYHCYKSFAERGFIIRKLAALSARRLIAEIERYRPEGHRVLVDFGCGNGSWLELFRMCAAPWEMHGTEIDDRNVSHIRALGFHAHACDDSNVDAVFEPNSVAVVYMHHVIEHVPSPLELLRKLRKILVPGGIIVGQTPDSECLERHIFADHWSQWHLPHHLTVFDKRTMAAHAAKADLDVVALKSSASGATQWAASALKYLAARRNRVYQWTREPLHPVLSLAFAPIAVFQGLVHHTSHLDFVLRKPV